MKDRVDILTLTFTHVCFTMEAEFRQRGFKNDKVLFIVITDR